MREHPLTPALERFYRSERAARISLLKRHIAAHLTRGIAPYLLVDMARMVEQAATARLEELIDVEIGQPAVRAAG
jgi:hypothetical protein